MWFWILGGLAVVSAGLNVWQWLAGRRFPLHDRHARRDFAPGVTLLKPLKGADAETADCLESWFAQDYPGKTQILFGVADPDDPVCEIVRGLIGEYPTVDAELVICQPILGPNAKVSSLTYLEAKAKHPLVLVSDADVFVPPDFLSELMDGFRDENVSLLNCFYAMAPPKSGGMVLESVAVNADFWSQVCQSNTLKKMDFALGAVMAVRRSALEKIGGFRPLVDYIADDYQLGNRVARAGGEIKIANVVVECREGPKTFREVWRHQLRWARTIRVCQPAPYFMSVLSNATFWTVLWILAGGWSFGARECLIIRLLTAMANLTRLTQRNERITEAIYAPLKDLVQFAVWAGAFLGSKVTWRGEEFRVAKGGKFERAPVVAGA
jgi:ceramide glucosyltransferase